ncbi:ComEA family DNA-binding protein [Aquimarina agarilytica]|uniref:ComEA family DNA-binding protein n=1 Tax=Aquimarina agarilytica TaxID=1087449 RepID=UPI0002899837|nr:helix-hairpin-helix domain-containing protein [Aquimarina agarilytica]
MILNNQHKLGIIKLGILLGVICFLIVLYNKYANIGASFVLNEEAQCFVDNQQLLLAEAKSKKEYTYYVNSISDYSGYQLGLSLEQIDRLFAYREAGNRIQTEADFKKVTNINEAHLDTIRQFLRYPKKIFIKIKKGQWKTKPIMLKQKLEMNTVTAIELQQKLKLPEFLAKRIVKFRSSLNGFDSLKQLEKVYGILPYQLKRIKANGFLK